MNLLAIDTSTERATVALSVNGDIRSEEQGHLRQHAQFLLPMIERLLASAQLHLNQLDGIVFGRGPGSFTGLRITCSVVKALAYAHDLPLFPVSTLAAIAHAAYQTEIPAEVHVLAMLDARMHEVYWGYYARDAAVADEKVSPVADITVPKVPLILAGVGFEQYVAQLPHILQTHIIQQVVVYPQAQAMIQLVQCGNIKAVSVIDALPVYIRNQVVQGEPRG